MASDLIFVKFIADQMSTVGEIKYRKINRYGRMATPMPGRTVID